jgi:hypothetical protein
MADPAVSSDTSVAPNANGTPHPVEIDKYDVHPMGEMYRRHRWIKPMDADWARYCDQMMSEHGSVRSSLVFDTRYKARARARKLEELWHNLGLRSRWEYREHVDRVKGGYIWTLESLGRQGNG